jgi:NADH-quinone oxidoreductase subunit J
MSIAFIILAGVTLGSAVAAMSLRNVVHCALCLVVTFAGLAGLYLRLDAEFVGLVQILVYVGAVAIVIAFAILLTRSGEGSGGMGEASWPVGLAVAGLVAGALVAAIAASPLAARQADERAVPEIKRIGEAMMGDYVLPLEVMALLLTAALIGAIIIAMQDKRRPGDR